MTTSWVSISITLGIFVLSHIVITVWWASRVNTILYIVQQELKELISEFKASRNIYITKEDASKYQANYERENKALWKNIDSIKNHLNIK